jgi:putative oxidoreductase
MNDRFAAYAPKVLSALRIIAGFCFSLHGFQKILAAFGGMGGTGSAAAFGTLPWVAGVLELFGGLLILAGLFTRPVAFILSGQMAVAYFMAHAPKGFWPLTNGGELAALYSWLFLYLAAAGGGDWSLDNIVRRKKAPGAG